MVQIYGVANNNDSEPNNHVAGDGEDSALLGGDSAVKRIERADGHATIVSCVSNLSNTIIGGGEYFLSQNSSVLILTSIRLQGMLTFPLVCGFPSIVYIEIHGR